MTRIAIVYGSSTNRTLAIAEDIAEHLAVPADDVIDAAECSPQDLREYEVIIAGVSTWEQGRPQGDWQRLGERLDGIDLHGVRAAVFGLGDAVGYPETYQDGMGWVHDALVEHGAEPIGAWPTAGYHFRRSQAVRGDRFCGLALDEDNEEARTPERLQAWLEQISHEAALG